MSRRKVGRYRIYEAEPAALKEIYDWVGQYKRFWRRNLTRLGEYLNSEK